jgi:hypothetical protein
MPALSMPNLSPKTILLGRGGDGGDAVTRGGRFGGFLATGGNGGLSYGSFNGAPLLPTGQLAASRGGDGGSASAVADCGGSCFPQDVNVECVVRETYDMCDKYRFPPPPRDEKLCSEFLNQAGQKGGPGTSVTASPKAPGDASPGYHGDDGSYTLSYSYGAGVDAKGTIGASASVSCTSANTNGGRGGPGTVGGTAGDGGAQGGHGGFGIIQGGDGGSADMTAGAGGKGGGGGDGGAALIEKTFFCGIQRAHAGPGGDGAKGGDSGGGSAQGGEGGPSYVLGGRGGDGRAYAADPGAGGLGGNGGAQASYCDGLGPCFVLEPAGQWGCGGLSGAAKLVTYQGGAGGLNNLTMVVRTGSSGTPPTQGVDSKGTGGVPSNSGSGTPRSPSCHAAVSAPVQLTDVTDIYDGAAIDTWQKLHSAGL